MNFVGLVSGGKDSLYSCYYMVSQGWCLKGFVYADPVQPYSYLFHSVNLNVVEHQAQAAGVPCVKVEVSGIKEDEAPGFAKGLSDALRLLGADSVVTGAIRSEYQRVRFDSICEAAQAKSFSPLWHKREETLLRAYLDDGFEFMLSGVYAMGLGPEWVGRAIGREDVSALLELSKKYGFSAVGEGGEYESLVVYCPLFKHRLNIRGTIRRGPVSTEYLIDKVNP
ncbi:MAG: diphthine--ammonia ligase [Candidatus Marsarchaeota archaeon]|nr:diphthine--ammonia ligase [Candidatus Marsarchaeota archaeon]